MTPFSKNEKVGVSVILFIVFIVSFFNFRVAIRRSRDAQRRADLGAISNALHDFQKDFGVFPLASEDGRILACTPDNFDEKLEKVDQENTGIQGYLAILAPCSYGTDGLFDLSDPTLEPYIKTLPSDPYLDKGRTYKYFSNTKRFQLYASLEGGIDEQGYDTTIVSRGLDCGGVVCSFGKTFGVTPLDKSIQEYENELIRQKEGLK